MLAKHVLEYGQGLARDAVALGAVGGLGGGIGFLREVGGRKAFELGSIHRCGHRKGFEAAEFVGAKVAAGLGSAHKDLGGVVDTVGEVQREALP